MQRAANLFDMERVAVESPFVETIWRTWSAPAEEFISVASSHCLLVVTKQRGGTYLTVRGPETRPSTWPIPVDAEFIGIQFRYGTFMPQLPPGSLVDQPRNLPGSSSTSFWLNGFAWEYPRFENADVFVERLAREGLVVRDPLVEAVLRDEAVNGRSQRSLQRRVLRATGLTRTTIRQIERAQRAVGLLDSGVSILDTVQRAGYADQAHLTRALRRFIGQTPAAIAVASGSQQAKEPGRDHV